VYYLHQNGSLIYKRELGDTVADLRESGGAMMRMLPSMPNVSAVG
jgi:hypothetical protein